MFALESTWVPQLAGRALNWLLPPHCLSCGVELAEVGHLCQSCWAGANFVAPPFCERCGLPFDVPAPATALCGPCSQRTPDFDRARTVFRYDDFSKSVILGFKHGDRTECAVALGRWMARVSRQALERPDLVVPVPLHRRRLMRRRYNQSGLLANVLAGQLDARAALDLLVRVRPTKSQGELSPTARRSNVSGAFSVRKSWRDRLEDANVLLVDDVLTTGATVEACARCLRRAGAGRIEVITLARVVRVKTAVI